MTVQPVTMDLAPFSIASNGSPQPGQKHRSSENFNFPDGWFSSVTNVKITASRGDVVFDVWYDLSDAFAAPDGPVEGAKQIKSGAQVPMANFISASKKTFFVGFYIANPIPPGGDGFTVTFTPA